MASALAVCFLVPPAFSPTAPADVVLPMAGFLVMGGLGAMFARSRSKTEESLRDSTRRFQMLADSAPVLIWEADPDGARQCFNEPWLRFTGRTLALTAFASVDDRVRLLSAGFQLHLAKPVDPGELSASVAAVSGRSFRLGRELRGSRIQLARIASSSPASKTCSRRT